MNIRGRVNLLAFILAAGLLLTSFACARVSQPTPLSFIAIPSNNILVDNSIFSPSDIIVETGASITWKNLDNISYFIEDNSQQFAFTLPAESAFSLSIPETGTYHYHCRIHPYMQGTIIVVDGASV